MPILRLRCPHCNHEFKGFVFDGTKSPERWICGRCGCDRAAELSGVAAPSHPWDVAPIGRDTGGAEGCERAKSCPCCL
jgi:hypothetical protein